MNDFNSGDDAVASAADAVDGEAKALPEAACDVSAKAAGDPRMVPAAIATPDMTRRWWCIPRLSLK
ncbi:MAG TPA: hypothetical protein VGS97_14635 [Actinocrinis sp.]|uniref:hypothetical protein n=1 Tax=Actinocrinis sp. TaxID=1920516 RepID=UPI002DDD1857|nr:hypothetical protein [Actinocrinis sp.]HEV2345333.1 hypothetical protein [Actinocrinis sp.]